VYLEVVASVQQLCLNSRPEPEELNGDPTVDISLFKHDFIITASTAAS
jgi:hypothetical protein